MGKCSWSTEAGARFRLDLTVAAGRWRLAAVDEVLELLLVLVGVPVRLVAKHPTVLDEVFERCARVAGRAKAQLPGRFGRGEGPAPPQQVEQLRREERDAGGAERERGQAQAQRRE